MQPTFVVTTVPGQGILLSPSGIVVGDSVRSVQLVGQVGSRLQTPPVQIDVVEQPDSLAASSSTTSKLTAIGTELLVTSAPLSVIVTSGSGAARGGVRSIIVRYRVDRWFPNTFTFPDTTLVLIDDAGRFQRHGRPNDGRHDRRVRRSVPEGSSAPSGVSTACDITASATNLKGVPLRGSPVRFTITTK